MMFPYARGRWVGEYHDLQRFVVFELSIPAAFAAHRQDAPHQTRWIRPFIDLDGGTTLEACEGPAQGFTLTRWIFGESDNVGARQMLNRMGYRVIEQWLLTEEAVYLEWLKTMEAFNPSVAPERETRFLDNQPDCNDSFLTAKSPNIAVGG